MDDSTVVEVRDLRQRYGEFPAIDGISFSVSAGEVFALLGTNGAGKTTTIDALAGFRAPSEGTVRVFGTDPARQRHAIAPRIGIMLQEAGFFEGLTVAETIVAWRGFTPGARGADEAMALVDLADKAGTPVGKLSGGEKRRLDLALALLGGPELLYLDEPTTGLDPEARRRTWELLRSLVAGGMTVILTTHYMEEAEFLADRVAIMDGGRIVREGSVAEVIGTSTGRISFRAPRNLGVDDLPPLSGARVSAADGRFELSTPDPQRTLHNLLVWADAAGVTLPELQVSTGSLEDTFLEVARAGKGEQ